MRTNNSTLRFVLIAILACLLTACDGGIFGTGDGQIIPVDSANSDSSPTDSSPPDSGIGGDAADVPPISPSPGDSEANTDSQTFNNLQIGTTSTTPLLNVINVSDRTITTRDNANGEDLFAAAIAAGTFSQTAPLQLGENNLTIMDTDTSEALLAIRPLNVGASSLTTVVVRNSPAQAVNVVILRSTSLSLTPSVAQLRVLQANLLSDEDSVATFSLQPSGMSPGSAEVNFTDISVAEASSANYQSVNPGDYQLIDSLGRIEPELLSMQAGKIYTLIVLGSPEPAILLHDDSLLVP